MQDLLQRRQLLREDPTILALTRSPRQAAGTSPDDPSATGSSNGTFVDASESATPSTDTEVGEDPAAAKETPEKADPFLVVFPSGASDNPAGWSLMRRAMIAALVAQIALLVGLASSINSAGAVQAAAGLGVSQEVVSPTDRARSWKRR